MRRLSSNIWMVLHCAFDSEQSPSLYRWNIINVLSVYIYRHIIWESFNFLFRWLNCAVAILLIIWGSLKGLETFPADTGQEMWPVCHSGWHVKTNQSHSHSYIQAILESPFNLTRGRKPEYPEEMIACKLHTERPCPSRSLNQEPSYCEATVLTTAPLKNRSV